ncbi:hypothetical protein [Paenibacillus sp. CFBP 13594]|nr:hypothetical protein [Paenibacillus sp. CFBP 13594]
MSFKKVRTFITNGTGKWVEFPLTDEDKVEIKIPSKMIMNHCV